MISVPSDVLLEIAKKLDPVTYSQLSETSSAIFRCLHHGRYTTNEGTCAILEQKKEEYRIEQLQLASVHRNGWDIRFIDNPSEQVQLAAVKQNGLAIVHIKNPSKRVQLAAVQQNGYAIKFIEDPLACASKSEQVQLAAVQQDSLAIHYIKNPLASASKSAQVQLAANWRLENK